MAKEESVTFELAKIHYLQCCDCGLVHKIEHIIVGDTVLLTFTRDEKQTSEARSKESSMCEALDAAILKDMGDPNSFLRKPHTAQYEDYL